MARRGLSWILLLALVLAPALGQLHRIAHGSPAATAHVHSHAESADAQADHAHDTQGAGWFAGLFSAHDLPDCRLYDQLTHADTLPSLPLLVLPLVLTPFLFRRLQREAVARQADLFDARGPPALR